MGNRLMLALDHLAVAAQTLDEGRARVEDALGVTLQTGGQHAHFGTHNLLLGLEEGLYLEVIAIDPAAPSPGCARWFDLDRFAGTPRLTNWICRTDDLGGAVDEYPRAGAPVALARGDLRWQMAVPEDGVLPFAGMFPALIEWQGKAHPAERLTASGCRLKRLVVSHPRGNELRSVLAGALKDDRVVFDTGAAALLVEIETPGGTRVLT